MYDVIVVGARCAGSATAMLLARQGHRVLVVDRATFPSDTNSTHYVQQPAVARLRDWGVLDEVVATGCPPIPTFGLDLGPVALRGHPAPYDGMRLAYAPRRFLLDTILVEAAAAAGGSVMTGVTVEGLLEEDGVVVGIRGRTDQGGVVHERARLVVGADGLHSRVAKEVGAPVVEDRGILQCAYYTYWSGVEVGGMEAFVRDDTGAAAIPTNDGLTCIPVVWPRARLAEVRGDVEDSYLAVLDRTPLGEQVRAGRREHRWRAVGDLPNIVRKPVGAGWALVGDAGLHQDPVTAHGITNAFVGAELLAGWVDRVLRGELPMADALASYHRERDAAAWPMFELTSQFASPEPPPPELLGVLRGLEGDDEATDQWFGVLAATVHPDDFFAARAPTLAH